MRNTKIIQSPDERKSEILKKYFKSISKFWTLSTKDERELCKRVFEGDEKAREQLLQCNLKLVISIAKKYQGYGISLLDLIQEGNKGLVLGIEHYDINRKTKFSTCASWWIKYAIKKALTDNSRIVKIPSSQYNRYRQVKKFVDPIEQENQRIPTSEEIADELNLQKEQIEIALSNPSTTVPYLTPTNGDMAKNYYALPFKDKDISVEEKIERDSLFELMDTILSKLTKREETVVRKIFGIGCEEMSIKEIADELGLTYERIRQIKKIALAKIKQRHPNLNKELYND